MKTFFRDIFEYHNYMNLKLIDLFTEKSNKISERCIFLFSHSLNAHQIWNSRILKTDSGGLNDIHTIESFKSLNDDNHSTTIRILDKFNLNDKIEYKSFKADPFINTVQEILFQIANHFTHHKGQIMSDLRQNGIEPFVSDYIFYKRSPK